MHACQVNMIHLLLNCLGSSNVGAIIGGVVGVLLSVVIIVMVIAIVVISLHLRYNKGMTIITLSVSPLGISKWFIIKLLGIVTFCYIFFKPLRLIIILSP